MSLNFLSTSSSAPNKMRRAKSHVHHLIRRIPLPVFFVGLLIILCPFAVIHFSPAFRLPPPSSRDVDVPLQDAVPSRKYKYEETAEPPLSGLKTWLKEAVLPDLSPAVLRPPEIIKDGQAHRVSCPIVPKNPSKPDFDLGNLTYTLTELNADGDTGVWDEEMDKQYLAGLEWKKNQTEEQLLVYIVPFSHADPGWLNTVEDYFATSTKFALDNMLEYLQQWPDMTFIWAETSYFKMWWETLKDQAKNNVKQLIKTGRLELVNGGFVMPDEATCHYYAILHQYIYGHQWLLDNVGVVPEHGFSIDPFGHSSSMPYFLKNLDFKSMFIQRIHYNLRKHLVKHNASEFIWEQPWDNKDQASMFCHLAPNHLYTIKNICSLQPGNCYFFDFKDIIFEIDNTQIVQQSKILLEQLKKTASIYAHNVVLYILGDDFRWSEKSEWTNQYHNYKRIIKELNNNPANNIKIQFGTLKDYYTTVFTRMGSPETPPTNLPKIQGDFFPYADKYEDYWTGYFTSRPFYKQMSRELERDLRTAEILYVLTRLSNKNMTAKSFEEDLIGLQRAAIGLGLFQHHDAITGTSKRAVAFDYGEKLQNGLLMAHAVILKNIYRLANLASRTKSPKANIILENYRSNALSLPIKSPLHFTKTDTKRKVFIFNPLVRSHEVVIHLFADTQNIQIMDTNGKKLSYQVTPVLNDLNPDGVFFDILRISFFIRLDPLALKAITIRSLGTRSDKIKIQERQKTSLRSNDDAKIAGFTAKPLDTNSDTIVLKNSFFSAIFSSETGALESIATKDGKVHRTQLEFKRYETQASGAYLFRPMGVADVHPYPRTIRIIEGPLFTELQLISPRTFSHVTRIYNTTSDLGRALELETVVDLSNQPNAELVLKISSDIKNGKVFYTDSNGFQIIKRKVSHSLPMAANFYPATTMGYLQDNHTRLTLHLTQAHGVGSLKSGDIEVMLDRNLLQDDGRGVGEALTDLRVVKSIMKLQIESEGFCVDCAYSNPTDAATRVNLDVNNPPFITFEQSASNLTSFDYQPVDVALPCDVQLVMMKPVTYRLDERRIGMTFHRMGMDCSPSRTDQDICSTGKDAVMLNSLLKDAHFKSYNETGFNFISPRKRLSIKTPVRIEPMGITAVTAFMP